MVFQFKLHENEIYIVLETEKVTKSRMLKWACGGDEE